MERDSSEKIELLYSTAKSVGRNDCIRPALSLLYVYKNDIRRLFLHFSASTIFAFMIFSEADTIQPDIQVFNNESEKRPELCNIQDYQTGSIYETRIIIDNHTGAHMDAPLHMLENTIERGCRRLLFFILAHLKLKGIEAAPARAILLGF
jgi:hypothetical protein